jgi:ribosomal-protein-alanine N-acetyltransferase
MTIRPAAGDDLPAIERIQRASPAAAQWDPASYLDYECTVAEEGAAILGFLVIRQTVPGEHEILNLAVDPSQRRRGAARQLLLRALDEHSGAWFLEVRESNAEAIHFYEVMGFQRVGRRPDYYHNPSEPAIVMKINS